MPESARKNILGMLLPVILELLETEAGRAVIKNLLEGLEKAIEKSPAEWDNRLLPVIAVLKMLYS